MILDKCVCCLNGTKLFKFNLPTPLRIADRPFPFKSHLANCYFENVLGFSLFHIEIKLCVFFCSNFLQPLCDVDFLCWNINLAPLEMLLTPVQIEMSFSSTWMICNLLVPVSGNVGHTKDSMSTITKLRLLHRRRCTAAPKVKNHSIKSPIMHGSFYAAIHFHNQQNCPVFTVKTATETWTHILTEKKPPGFIP